MSDSNSAEVDQETTAKNISNKDKRKEPKAKRQRTDINERVLTDPFRRLSTMKAMSILMVGLDGAGKCTILNKLGGENVSKTDIPGCYIETLVYNNITLKAWDVSGEFETTLQGSNSLKDTKGLIIVVDSSDKGRLAEAKYKLFKLLNEESLKDVALLVFANKQDEPNPMNEAEITRRLLLSTLPQRHCYVQNTCATSGAGLYEGLNWLSKKVKYTFDTSLEGVSEGLNRLRASGANKKYDDMPSCITSQPTDKELVQFLVRLIDGKDIYPDRVRRVNLFENHPAVIIRDFSRSGDLLPCMLGTSKYYLFYSAVPDDAICCERGYHPFQDQAKGVWEPISYSFVFHCGFFDGRDRYGEVQTFSYKPANEATSCWRMDMYGIVDFPRPQPNMVVCKVFESANSKNARAVTNIAAETREIQEALNRRSAHRAKIKLLEAATREERTKENSCHVGIGVKVQRLLKEVHKYERDEHKEADVIDPPNRERTS